MEHDQSLVNVHFITVTCFTWNFNLQDCIAARWIQRTLIVEFRDEIIKTVIQFLKRFFVKRNPTESIENSAIKFWYNKIKDTCYIRA